MANDAYDNAITDREMTLRFRRKERRRIKPDNRAMNYHNAVRIVRAIRGTTQTDLARACGINQEYISFIETKRRRASAAIMTRIRRALRVSPAFMAILASDKASLRRMGDAEAQIIGREMIRMLKEESR